MGKQSESQESPAGLAGYYCSPNGKFLFDCLLDRAVARGWGRRLSSAAVASVPLAPQHSRNRWVCRVLRLARIHKWCPRRSRRRRGRSQKWDRPSSVLFSFDPPGNRPEAIEWLLIFFRVTGRKKEIKIGWEGREESVQWWIHQNIRTRKSSWYIQLRDPRSFSLVLGRLCVRPTVPRWCFCVIVSFHSQLFLPLLGCGRLFFPSTKMTFFSSLLTKISAIRSLIFFCLFWKPLWEPTAKEIRSCNLVFTLTTLGSFNVSRSGGPPRAFDYLIRIAERPARQEAKRSRRFLVIRFKSHFNNDRPAHKAPGVLK